MRTYTKLWNTLLDSSVWQYDDATRVVWITLLGMSNKEGIVDAWIPGVASRARVSIDSVTRALEIF